MRSLFLAVVAVCSFGCGGVDPMTEVRLVISVDESLAPQDLRVRVFNTERALVVDDQVAVANVERPFEIHLFPEGEGPRGYFVVLDLVGAAAQPLGTQRVIGNYVVGQSRILRVHFADTCSGFPCSGRETCRDESGVATCQHACFEPQSPEAQALPVSTGCPITVWVDGATGEDDPMACFGPDTPCASVAYALDTYLAEGRGGTINVAGGSTYAPVLLDGGGMIVHSGTVDVPTTIRAWPGTGRPAFDGLGAGPAIQTCCGTDAANHVVLEGLEATNGLNYGILVQGTGVTDAILRDNLVRGTVIDSPVASQATHAGISVQDGASNVRLIGNVVRDNAAIGVADDGSPAVTQGVSITNSGAGMVVEGNRIVDNGGAGIRLSVRDAVVRNNQVLNNGGSGIRLISAANVLIEDNMVCNADAGGIFGLDSPEVTVRYNTVVGSRADGVGVRGTSDRWTVTHNIIAFGASAGLSRDVDGPEPFDAMNLYWMNEGEAMDLTTPDGMNWVDVVNPMLVDTATCDLALGPGSEAARLVEGGPVGARTGPEQ